MSRSNLPPLAPRDLPEPLPLRRMIGPSIIFLGMALGSGELVLWPYLTIQHGFVIFWGALVGLCTQFFLNMEIARYALATGEGIMTGFLRVSRHLGWVWLVLIGLGDLWPAWATGAGTLLGYLVGGDATVYAIIGLVVCGLLLTLSPVVYRTLEWLELVLVVGIVVAVTVAAIWAVDGEAVAALGHGLTHPGLPANLDMAMFLAALAFAGAGGSANLVQSYYVRDKGYAMGKYASRLVSPFTGKEETAATTGFTIIDSPENARRWRAWWRAVNLEHLLVFLLLGSVMMILLSLIAFSAAGGESIPRSLGFVATIADRVAAGVGPWFRVLYLVMGVTVLFSTQVAALDVLSRFVSEIVKVAYLRERARPTASQLYAGMVWLQVVFGIAILLAGLNQPLTLLVITAAQGGVTMFLYSGLLVWMNRRLLPATARIGTARMLMLFWAFAFYGYFSLQLLLALPSKLS